MKNLNKITKYFITLFWLGLCCTTLKGEVVITEFFILQADNSHAPQYVELYNNSDSLIDLTDWSITTLYDNGDVIFKTELVREMAFNDLEEAEKDYLLYKEGFSSYKYQE